MPRVLLVDDDPHDRELALAAFKRVAPDAEIHVAEGGEEAVRRLGADRTAEEADCPDLVILDYKMPRMSGADVLRRLRSDPIACKSPIVVFSSTDSERDISECYALGANAFVRKPASYSELAEALSSIVAFWTKWVVSRPPESAALC